MDFKSVIKDKTRLKKIMQSAFRSVDINGSGFLDQNQLGQVLVQVAKDIGVEIPSKQQISDIISEIDQNGDGQLSKQQFHVLIEQVLQLMAECDQQ